MRNNILEVGTRNNIEVQGRRYSLSQLISESYQTLYNCELDSNLYKLTESHIEDIKKNPGDISRLSQDLEVLKGLMKLGESAKIEESDIPDDEDQEEEVIPEEDEDEEELSEEEESSEDEKEEMPPEEEEVITDSEEEDVFPEEDEENPEITPEELQELKKHLKEIRKARRACESAEADLNDPEEAENPDRMKETGRFPESRSWKSEKSSMMKALKNFRESSNKKAFYKSFSKLHERMKDPTPLTMDESILLYKASNSAMTHLTVELEHNPEFIYTFRECTAILSEDNNKLLECICKQKSPTESLVESYKDFSGILLESEDYEDEEKDMVEEDENVVLPDEEEEETPKEEIDEMNPVAAAAVGSLASRVKDVGVGANVGANVSFKDSEEAPDEEEYEDDLSEEEEPTEEPALEEEEPVEEEDDVDMDSEITDEEAEELRNKLAEIRKNRK